MASKPKSAKREKAPTRHELRFEALPTTNTSVIYVVGALGALMMGAGAWAQFGPSLSDSGLAPVAMAPYVLFTGALVVAVAIWLGTSGQAPLRVGDAGVGIEKGPLKRIPWYAIDRIEWRQETVRVMGKDESGEALTILAPVASHAQAAAWIVKQARQRIPSRVDVPADATLAEPQREGGREIVLGPPQVVGKRCAASGLIIAYEPDARVCPRCMLVYHKSKVPELCACGSRLADVMRSDSEIQNRS
jgi:hypothetical protein